MVLCPGLEGGDILTDRRRRPRGFVPILALALLAACTPEPPPLLRVGTSLWPGYEPLFLARELGYFEGASIRLVEYPSATQVLRAYRNGVLEAACLTLDEVLLIESQQGEAPRIVAVMDVSNGADVLLARPPLASLADLKGRTVGVEDTALGAFMLSRVLERAGLARSDIALRSLEVNEHERAFRDGRLDAVITFEPVRTKLMVGGARVLFDSSEIPGEIVDVLGVKREALASQPEQVAVLLRGFFRALGYLQAHPEDASRRMAMRHEVTPQEFHALLQGLQLPDLRANLALLGERSSLPASGQALADVMLERRLIARPVNVGALLDPHPLRELAQ